MTTEGFLFTQKRKKRLYHLRSDAQEKISLQKKQLTHFLKKVADKIVVEEFDICHKFVDGLIYDSKHINYLISHNLVFDFIEYNDFKLNLLIN